MKSTATNPGPRVENRGRAILWMLATMGCFITLDTFMKLGLERYSLVQVTWGRFFFATLFTAIYCGRSLPRFDANQSADCNKRDVHFF